MAKKVIEHVDKESLTNFTKEAFEILDNKKGKALELAKLESASHFFVKEDCETEASEIQEEEPNFDVDIEPENFDENDLTDLESIIWDDEEFDDEIDEEE